MLAVVLLGVVRVHSVRHVSAEQETAVDGSVVILPVELAWSAAEAVEDPLRRLDDHIAVGTLRRLRSNLLMIEQHDHFDLRVISLIEWDLGALNHGVQAAKRARHVVEARRADKLVLQADEAAWLSIVASQLEVDDLVALDLEIIGDQLCQIAKMALFQVPCIL